MPTNDWAVEEAKKIWSNACSNYKNFGNTKPYMIIANALTKAYEKGLEHAGDYFGGVLAVHGVDVDGIQYHQKKVKELVKPSVR